MTSEERKPNWPLACFVFALMAGAVVALAFPASRMVGAAILFGYWVVVAYAFQVSLYGAGFTRSDVWKRLVSASIVLTVFAIGLPPGVKIFVVFFAAVEVGLAWWWHRRLGAANPRSPWKPQGEEIRD
ncbi:MAG TPA: hypothetical protein VGG30_12775 [Pirellulales bacterium]|jgi:hypothetical protein